MPTPPSSKQINVPVSGEYIDMFNELLEHWDLSSDAEVFRVALKKAYKQRKIEIQEFKEFLIKELEPMIDEILEKREKKEKRGIRKDFIIQL